MNPATIALLGQILGQVAPQLLLGLFGQKPRPKVSVEEGALLGTRNSLGQMNLTRQQAIQPLYQALAAGLFNNLPTSFTTNRPGPYGSNLGNSNSAQWNGSFYTGM